MNRSVKIQGTRHIAHLGGPFSGKFWIATVACLLPWAPTAGYGQVGSLRLNTGEKQPVIGTAFLVDREGYLATSLQLVQGASHGNWTLPNGRFYMLEGWVAASRAHDVVLLKVERPGKVQPAILADDMPLKPLDLLGPIPGPLSPPLRAQLAARVPGAGAKEYYYTPRLRHVLSGTELLAGLEKLPPRAPGQGPDVQWLVLAPAIYASQCAAWRIALNDKQPLERDWN